MPQPASRPHPARRSASLEYQSASLVEIRPSAASFTPPEFAGLCPSYALPSNHSVACHATVVALRPACFMIESGHCHGYRCAHPGYLPTDRAQGRVGAERCDPPSTDTTDDAPPTQMGNRIPSFADDDLADYAFGSTPTCFKSNSGWRL